MLRLIVFRVNDLAVANVGIERISAEFARLVRMYSEWLLRNVVGFIHQLTYLQLYSVDQWTILVF
jgi:hypothetical protein